MAAEDDGNFFSRWSRRKVQVRTGQPPPAEPPAVSPAPVTAVVSQPLRSASMPAVSTSAAAHPPAVDQSAALAQTRSTPTDEASPLTLDDVAQLTPEGDFKPFMARQVSPEVRNAAVKKLFTDPHFNVMDGLDIYIDDYSKPSPLSAADMAQMVGAQFLKLVDDPEAVKPPATQAAGPDQPPLPSEQTPVATDPLAAQPGAEPSPPNALAPASDTSEPDHDHADLQLQPDHAPERESPGRGAG